MELCLADLGFKDYKATLDLQRKLWALRADGCLPDTLLLVEHDHTITLGRSAKSSDLLLAPDKLADIGIPVYDLERGGECTYHGPGQLVCYPIIKLPNERGAVSTFIHRLEEVMVRTLDEFGIVCTRKAGEPGAWVGQKKIGSVGVAVKRWVTYHGLALNVSTDLSQFRYIRPCGKEWQVMTSMEQVLGRKVEMKEVGEAISHSFAEIFKIKVILKSAQAIAQTGMAGRPVCI